MTGQVAITALVLLTIYFFLSITFYDWSIPVIEFPIIGDLVSIKPFQMLQPYSLFVGGALVLLVAYTYRRKNK